jgi:alpha-L-fucosidase 2
MPLLYHNGSSVTWYVCDIDLMHEIGAMLYFPTPTQMRIDVSRTDVYDTRQPGSRFSLNNFVYDRPRLPIGYWIIDLPNGSPLVNASMRIELWDAQVTGIVNTVTTSIQFRLLALSTSDAFVLEINTISGTPPKDGMFHPLIAASTWAKQEPKYAYNNLAVVTIVNQVIRWEQKLLGGGSFSTAYRIIDSTGSIPQQRIIWSISPVVGQRSPDVAMTSVINAMANLDQLYDQHRNWWHNYYPDSLITMTSTRMESFYWLQMYKMASATRENGAPFDLEGPWFVEGTSWPDLHYDLNVQLVYSPVRTHIYLFSCYCDTSGFNVANK